MIGPVGLAVWTMIVFLAGFITGVIDANRR